MKRTTADKYSPKFDKKKQCGRHYKGNRARVVKGKLVCTEDQTQEQCNQYLRVKWIKFLRIPNYVWLWLKQNAAIHILKALTDSFAGMPDNVIIERISEKYNLVLQLELKTEDGVMGPEQEKWAEDTAVVISRSPDDTIREVDEFLNTVERYKNGIVITHCNECSNIVNCIGSDILGDDRDKCKIPKKCPKRG
jgi:hypothetical protein